MCHDHTSTLNYKWLQRYGSDQWSVKNPDRKGRDEVKIDKVLVAPSGNRVLLAIPDIQPVNQILAKLDLKTADGGEFEEEFYMTINRVPGD